MYSIREARQIQATRNIHIIGKAIASRCRFCCRGDIHTGTDEEFLDLVNSPKYSDKTECYFLLQTSMLEFIHTSYGPSYVELMRIHTDNKVRLAGILITDPEMREYILDITGKSKGIDRCSLDASNGRKAFGLTLLHHKFIDEEVVVTLSTKWLMEETRLTMNNLRGEEAFEEHGHFNPNNNNRIRLP